MVVETTVPKYDDRIVSFADILGFSDRVLNAKDEELQDLLKMVSAFRNAFSADLDLVPPEVNRSNDDIFIPFSDGFLRSSSNVYAPLFYEIMGFVHGIMEIVWKGHLVRGAISHGKIYYDEKSGGMISPAFIRAYQLE